MCGLPPGQRPVCDQIQRWLGAGRPEQQQPQSEYPEEDIETGAHIEQSDEEAALTDKLCGTCHLPMTDPYVLDCKHLFCEDCIISVRGQDEARCPSCKAATRASTIAIKKSTARKQTADDALTTIPDDLLATSKMAAIKVSYDNGYGLSNMNLHMLIFQDPNSHLVIRGSGRQNHSLLPVLTAVSVFSPCCPRKARPLLISALA